MPPTLTVVTSDRAEDLVARLADELARDPLSPFETEQVVVQSQGTERWLRNELATRLGCAASTRFPFPAGFCHGLARALTGEAEPIDRRFDREALTWRILDLFERDLTAEPVFEPLRAFVESGDTRKRLGLAARLAARFDDYQLYRAGTLLSWEQGDREGATGHERWQGELWRRLCGDGAPRHLARWFTAAVERLESADAAPAGLPRRISVFGVSTLPPLFVRLLRAAGRFVPVRLYVTAPPRATWQGKDAPDSALYAAFGHTSRELLALCDGPGTAWEELHGASATSPGTCLAQLQADARAGVTRGREPGLAAPVALRAGDDSLTLHDCHSPMREMEVLRDQLFAAFEADPTLRPHDVLVMVPDVPTYAPLAETVFGVAEPELPRIPYKVADRPFSQESSLAGALLRLVRLVGARCTVAEVLELFDVPAVRRAAGITESGAESVVAWVEETGIRWARDGAMRRDAFGLPAVEANSWRAGLDRLLMGYATGPEESLVADVLPYAGQTIGDPETLGAFAWWVTRLFETLDAWREPRPLAAWGDALRLAVATFLKPGDEGERESLAQLLAGIDQLAALEEMVGAERALDLGVVRDWLERTLGDDSRGTGFLTGGMTICALKPMRAIPFRVIAVLGLDDASFPRSERRAAYDLLELEPQRGDPDRRADDRQLFLDTILAARERLILSYVGRSAKNNAERAVSVVVAELLDQMDRGFDTGRADRDGKPLPALRVIARRHRLQPFSGRYFGEKPDAASEEADAPPLFTYSRLNARAYAAAAEAGKSDTRAAGAPFVVAALSTAGSTTSDRRLPTPDAIALSDLIACWTNPARFFCERTLGLKLPGEGDVLDDCEPLAVDGLTRYAVHDRILRRHLGGTRDLDGERREAVARAELPSGALTGVWFDTLNDQIESLLDTIGSPRFEEPVPVRVDGGGWVLTGTVDGIRTDAPRDAARGQAVRMQFRAGKCRNRDLVQAWLTQLAYTAAVGPAWTDVIGTDARHAIGCVDDPQMLLGQLVEGYRAALAAPLPVFDRASHAFAEQGWKLGRGSRSEKDPLDCAREKFVRDFQGFGDETDAYVALCWRARDPFADPDDFMRWSGILWQPLLERLDAVAEVPA